MRVTKVRVGVEPVSVINDAFIMLPGFRHISQGSMDISLLHEAIEGERKQGSKINSPRGWDGLLWVQTRDSD